jgi:hypothetical protein
VFASQQLCSTGLVGWLVCYPVDTDNRVFHTARHTCLESNSQPEEIPQHFIRRCVKLGPPATTGPDDDNAIRVCSKLLERELVRETEVPGENLPQCQPITWRQAKQRGQRPIEWMPLPRIGTETWPLYVRVQRRMFY